MAESSATLLAAAWTTAVVCAVAAYAVRRLSASAPARLPAVIGAFAGLVAVLPAVLVALQTGPDAAPPTPGAPPPAAVSPAATIAPAPPAAGARW